MPNMFVLTCLSIILTLFTCFVFGEESYYTRKDEPCGKTRPILYKENEKSHRMVEILFVNNEINDCFIYGNKKIAENWISKFVCKPVVRFVKKRVLTRMAEKCSDWLMAKIRTGQVPRYTDTDFPKEYNNKIDRNFYDGIMIYPGTKWCGAGDVSANYDDLGEEIETDKCCRTHDSCFDYIETGQTKYNLTNRAIHTKSHCSCDEKFRECLLSVGNSAAKKLAVLYFNVIQVQCFKKDHPIIKCLEYRGISSFWQSCQKYLLDYYMEKIYQFFDAIFVD